MRFCLFSDFHYKKRMYAATISMLQKIIDKAGKAGVDFILHCGDACNDYYGSPEFINCLLKNDKDIPVYGVYGNHELESEHNCMAYVTPNICNRISDVVWGTKDKKIGDGNISYYYFDRDSFRIICLDTNYSFNENKNEWQHNQQEYWSFPKGNIKSYALGDDQIKWLKCVIEDAMNNDKHCIFVSHAPFIKEWRAEVMTREDCDTVGDIINSANAIKQKTVIACFSGHWHTDRHIVKDNVLFFDTNASVNGFWEEGHSDRHYAVNQTYEFFDYDYTGKKKGVAIISPLDDTVMGRETWYFQDPLSTIVEISDGCTVTVEGMDTKWIYGILPPTTDINVTPKISSLIFIPEN